MSLVGLHGHPCMTGHRAVSAAVAVAVALAAEAEGLAQVSIDNHPLQQIHQAMWQPEYPRIELNSM